VKIELPVDESRGLWGPAFVKLRDWVVVRSQAIIGCDRYDLAVHVQTLENTMKKKE